MRVQDHKAEEGNTESEQAGLSLRAKTDAVAQSAGRRRVAEVDVD